MKAAVYTRVSTEDQKLGLESQKRSISLFLASKGINKYEEYIDHGISAKNTDRPRFKELLKDANAGNIQLLIVWKLDRLSRKLSDLLELIKTFDKLGIKIISIHENIDMTTTHGTAMMQMIGVFAELERNMCSDRTKAALAVLKANGQKLGRPNKIGNELKLQIKSLRDSGLSYREIAREVKLSTNSVFKVLTVELSTKKNE